MDTLIKILKSKTYIIVFIYLFCYNQAFCQKEAQKDTIVFKREFKSNEEFIYKDQAFRLVVEGFNKDGESEYNFTLTNLDSNTKEENKSIPSDKTSFILSTLNSEFFRNRFSKAVKNLLVKDNPSNSPASTKNDGSVKKNNQEESANNSTEEPKSEENKTATTEQSKTPNQKGGNSANNGEDASIKPNNNSDDDKWLNDIAARIFQNLYLKSLDILSNTPKAGFLFVKKSIDFDSLRVPFSSRRKLLFKLNQTINEIIIAQNKIDELQKINRYNQTVSDASVSHAVILSEVILPIKNIEPLDVRELHTSALKFNSYRQLTFDLNVDHKPSYIGNESKNISIIRNPKSFKKNKLAASLTNAMKNVNQLKQQVIIAENKKKIDEKYASIQDSLKANEEKIIVYSRNLNEGTDEKKLANIYQERQGIEREMEYLESNNMYAKSGNSYLDTTVGRTYNLYYSNKLASLRKRRDELLSQERELKAVNQNEISSKIKEVDELKKVQASLNEEKAKLEQLRDSLQRPNNHTKLLIRKIEIEFFNSAIKNITVDGTINGRQYFLSNDFPIAFAAIGDIAKLHKYRLYNFNNGRSSVSISLGDLLEYMPQLNVNAEDYSPVNQVKVFKPNENSGDILLKERTSELLRAKIFSDFVGLKNNAPNGLIQTEISKPIIITPYRRRIWPNIPINWGIFHSIEPTLWIAKVEEKNKYLVPGFVSDNSKLRYVTTMNLLSHTNLSVGTDLNLIVMDAPLIKSSLYWNVGAYMSRVAIRLDTTIKDDFNVNFSNLFTELKYEVKPDTRYGMAFSWRVSLISMREDKIGDVKLQQLNDTEEFTGKFASSPMSTFKLNFFLKPSLESNDELFFRATYNSLSNNLNDNFYQVQVGYSFRILTTRK